MTTQIQIWIQITALITYGVSIIGIVTFVLNNTRVEANKRAEIYKRIDTERNVSESTYVRKDICAVHHDYLGKELKEVKATIKSGQDATEKKLDRLLKINGKE